MEHCDRSVVEGVALLVAVVVVWSGSSPVSNGIFRDTYCMMCVTTFSRKKSQPSCCWDGRCWDAPKYLTFHVVIYVILAPDAKQFGVYLLCEFIFTYALGSKTYVWM